jgi:hypothetical protein
VDAQRGAHQEPHVATRDTLRATQAMRIVASVMHSCCAPHANETAEMKNEQRRDDTNVNSDELLAPMTGEDCEETW